MGRCYNCGVEILGAGPEETLCPRCKNMYRMEQEARDRERYAYDQQQMQAQRAAAREARKGEYREMAAQNGMSGYHEYKVVRLTDESGKLNYDRIEDMLSSLSAEGWHLISSKSFGVSDGPNAERLSLDSEVFGHGVLVFEKYIKI